MKTALFFLLHHTFLYIYQKVNQIIFYFITKNTLKKDKWNNYKYISNMKEWDLINSLDHLCKYFQKRKNYKSDGPKGILHHYNSEIEFFGRGYDCEDVAIWAQKKLEQFGYKTQMIGIIGNTLGSWHYDLYFENDNNYYLFNYGNLIISQKSIHGCLQQLSTYTVNNKNPYEIGKTIFWKCYY